MTQSNPIVSQTSFIGDSWRITVYLDDCQEKVYDRAGGKTCRSTDKYTLPPKVTGRTVRIRVKGTPATEFKTVLLDYNITKGNLK